MYMNIYIQESRSTIGPLPILGMQVYSTLLFWSPYIRLVRSLLINSDPDP